VSAEDPNGRFKLVTKFNPNVLAVIDGNVANFNGLAGQSSTNNGMLFPDIVGNLRVDQAWGSAQVMAAMHDASGAYYTGTDVSSGHPNNAFGWAVGGAFSINLPSFGATSNVNSQPNVDQLRVSASYTRGAVGYATNENGGSFLVNGNNSIAFANLYDGWYNNQFPGGAQVQMSTAWSVYGGYQHLWTPNWRTSLYGGYFKFDPGGNENSLACGAISNPGSCLSWSTWQVGSRTQWNPVSQLDVGVDVLYSKLNGEFSGSAPGAIGSFPINGKSINSFGDQDVWSVMFRVQRNFWP
jgi:hypothetical protein